MATSAQTVDEYIAAQPAEAQVVLQQIRQRVHRAVPGVAETISYQMPTFRRGRTSLVHMAGWKHDVSLYPVPDGVDEVSEPRVARYATGRGTLRLPLDEPIPYDVVDRVIALLLQQARPVLADAELFVLAEQMLVEVLGRIGPADREIVLPPRYEREGHDRPAPMWQVAQRYADDDAAVPDVLAGRARRRPEADLLADDPQAAIARISAAACAAALDVTDGERPVHTDEGDLPAGVYLRRLTVARSLVAHYVAAYLGSTACPLPEELARPLCQATEADAAQWRALGYFRAPMPLPDHVSWRDRFLLSAGHLPHPLGH